MIPDGDSRPENWFDVVVVGAGPAGLSSALELVRNGVKVAVVESGTQVGGMTRSFDLWDHRVDLGPHRFFSKDPRVTSLWLKMAGDDVHQFDRITRILYQGELYAYPLKPLETLAKLGPVRAAACISSYLWQRPIKRQAGDAETFEDWVVARFGRKLFEIFFRSYSEKLWGIPCERIDSDFAAQRIKGFNLREAVVNAIPGVRRSHVTLADRFPYPRGGAGSVYRRMADEIAKSGGTLKLECPVTGIRCERGRVRGVQLGDGSVLECGNVVSTMPLDRLMKGIRGIPDDVQRSMDRLRFRNTLLVYLKVEGKKHFPDHWIYVHTPELRVGRITNYGNWRAAREAVNWTVLSLEYWCDRTDSDWKADDGELIERAERELIATGLVGSSPIIGGHVERIGRCYPVYEQGYRECLQPVQAALEGIGGLSVIGRYGSFKYNNQDHSILMGLLAADNILGKARHDLWSVNTDYGSYQESGAAQEAFESLPRADGAPEADPERRRVAGPRETPIRRR